MSLSSTSSTRPALCDLPLERFIPSATKTTIVGQTRPNKRPLSPGGPSLFSPTKRRLLTQEGIFSPDKTVKIPFRGRSSPGGSFGDLLQGPGSPAKRLDHGRSLKSQSSELRVSSTPVRSQAPSPEVLSKMASNSTPRRNFVDDDFFATPERLQPSFTLVPRELPPTSDPQSIHYPGFIVYQDPHLLIMNPVSREVTLELEDDEWKENVLPRRKIKKTITDPFPAKSTPKQELERLFKARSTPATPRKVASKERQEVTSPTPRRTALCSQAGTPIITEEEKRQRRQMLRDEVEESGEMDEDEDDDL